MTDFAAHHAARLRQIDNVLDTSAKLALAYRDLYAASRTWVSERDFDDMLTDLGEQIEAIDDYLTREFEGPAA